MTEFIYLHGFASSPSSKKATAFKNKIKEMTGKRPAGSFNTTQTDYEKLLKK